MDSKWGGKSEIINMTLNVEQVRNISFQNETLIRLYSFLLKGALDSFETPLLCLPGHLHKRCVSKGVVLKDI